MSTITINFANTCKSKPTTKQEKIRESNNTKTKVLTDPLTFAELMMQGRTWCPAVFKGTRSNSNWIRQSVFALDFDCGIEPIVIIERCKALGIIPNVVYTSFSDNLELRKFRLVLFFNVEIKTPEKAKEMRLALMDLFPECDESCKDGGRMFFGAKEVLSVEEELNDIFVFAKYVLERRDRLTNALSSSLCSSSTKSGVCRGVAKPNFSKSIKKVNKKNFNFDLAIERLQILQDFMAGEKLKHPQLFGLATNLKYINAGLDLMIEVMRDWNKQGRIYYSDDKFEMIEQVRNSNYKSQRIYYFSPYESDSKYKNVFEACIK